MYSYECYKSKYIHVQSLVSHCDQGSTDSKRFPDSGRHSLKVSLHRKTSTINVMDQSHSNNNNIMVSPFNSSK